MMVVVVPSQLTALAARRVSALHARIINHFKEAFRPVILQEPGSAAALQPVNLRPLPAFKFLYLSKGMSTQGIPFD